MSGYKPRFGPESLVPILEDTLGKEGRVFTMRDAHHEGTDFYCDHAGWRDHDEFWVVNRDEGKAQKVERLVLVADPHPHEIFDPLDGASFPYGCDYDDPRGPVLIGLNVGDDIPAGWETVVWDSADREARQNWREESARGAIAKAGG